MRRVVGFALFVVIAVLAAAGSALADGAAEEVRCTRLPHPDLEVFMVVHATRARVAAVERRIRASRAVRTYAHLDRHDAYEEFARIFHRNSDLVHSIRAEDLPESFRIDVQGSPVQKVRRALKRLPGVESVETPGRSVPSVAMIQEVLRSCEARDYTVEVFMDFRATPAQVDAVRVHIADDPRVSLVRFLDRDAAFAEFRRIFADNPDLADAIRPSDLPESFRLRFPGRVDDAVLAELRALPGVDSLGSPGALCDALTDSG